MSNNANILITDSSLIIKELIIDDDRIIDYLSSIDSENYEEVLTKAIEIGLRVINDNHSINRTDYIDKAFQELQHDFENKIEDFITSVDEYLGKNGSLAKLLDPKNADSIPSKVAHTVMNDESGLKAYLDVHNYNSPLSQLKEELSKQLSELHDKIIEKRASEAMFEKTSLKGKEFEQDLLIMFQNLTKPYGDVVEYIGDKSTSQGSKTGDLLIGVRDPLLGDQELLIVIEAKDRTVISIEGSTGLLKELATAIQVREADFSIGIIKKRSALPQYIGDFRFYEPNMIVCCWEESLAVELAYRFARTVTLFRYFSQDNNKLDIENVKRFSIFLKTSIKKIDALRQDTKSIVTIAEGIENKVKEYYREIDEALNSLLKSLEEK